jgi:hypothetical protein
VSGRLGILLASTGGCGARGTAVGGREDGMVVVVVVVMVLSLIDWGVRGGGGDGDGGSSEAEERRSVRVVRAMLRGSWILLCGFGGNNRSSLKR